jgi:hypothetical protein
MILIPLPLSDGYHRWAVHHAVVSKEAPRSVHQGATPPLPAESLALVCRGGLRPLAYLRSRFLQTDGGLYHPALASLLCSDCLRQGPGLVRTFTHRCSPRPCSPRPAGLCRWASPPGFPMSVPPKLCGFDLLPLRNSHPMVFMGTSRHH